MTRKECSFLVGVTLLALLMLFPGSAVAAPGYFIQADVVRGAEGHPTGPRCVPNSVFVPGEGMVFRVKVYDAATGKELNDSMVRSRGVQVKVHLSNGKTLSTHYIPHPPNPHAPHHAKYWTVLWLIPKDAPSGHLTWQISASDKQGRTGHFAPIGQALGVADLQIVASK